MDEREMLINKIHIAMIDQFPNEDIDKAINRIIVIMNDYEVTKRSTEIVVYSGTYNERLLDAYIAFRRTEGIAESTLRSYKCRLSAFAEEMGKELDKVNYMDVRSYLSRKMSGNLKKSYIENDRSYLSAFYKWLYQEELIAKNPMEKIKPIKFGKEKEPPFTDWEIAKMRDGIKDKKNRAIIEFMLATGARREEAVNVKVSDINREKNTVTIRHGKGDKFRVTIISPVAVKYIDEYLKSRETKSEYLFLSRLGDKYTVNGMYYTIRTIGTSVGIDNTHPHRFRRTFATDCYRKGMNIGEIQTLMGHASPEVTMHYITMNTEMIVNKYAMH